MAISDLDLTSSGLFTDLDSLITSISAVSVASNVVTIRTTTPHGLTNGDSVTIFNLTNNSNSLTGTFTIAGVAGDTGFENIFTYNKTTGDLAQEAATDLSASEKAGLIAESATPGTFFTSQIEIDAVNKNFKFKSVSGNDVTSTGNILDAELSIAGRGIQGQALYSFFKFAYKTVPRLPQFNFPMLSITNEQFEFINGWYIDDSTNLTQQVRTVVQATIATQNTITTTDTTVDFRKYQAGDVIRVNSATNNNVTGTVSSTTKTTIVCTGTPFTNQGSAEEHTIDANFSVNSTQLIRTAGFTSRDELNTYTKLYYSGVITLGSFVDLIDQPYYIQENTATASTFNTSYTGPANQPVSILKRAKAGAVGGNNQNDIGFRAGNNVTITTTVTFTNPDQIVANSVGDFTGIRPGDIISVVDAGGGNDGRYFTVEENDNTTITTVEIDVASDANKTPTIDVLDSISAATTDLAIFSAGDILTIEDSASNNAIVPRVLTMDFAGSALAAAVGSCPAGSRVAFSIDSGLVTESNVGASLSADKRNTFAIFVRERGKSYADADLADIGVTELTNIVYRFPVTNANDIKIFTQDDSEIDQTDTDNAGADQTSLSGDNPSKIQIHYLRNPQTGDDNLNITGDYNTAATYYSGDVVRVPGTDTGGDGQIDRWWYKSGPNEEGNTSVANDNSASASYVTLTDNNGTNTLVFTAADPGVDGGKIQITAQTTSTDWTNVANDSYAVGDILVITNSTNNDGDNYRIASFENNGNPNDTAVLEISVTEGGKTFSYDGIKVSEGAPNGTNVVRKQSWVRWEITDPLPSRGGYTAVDPALQGGSRNVSGTGFAFNVIIDANDTRVDTSSPYVDDSGAGENDRNSTTGVYEFCQWALRRTGYLNEATASNPEFQKTGEIANLLVDFVGDTLVTRQGVFIDDITVADQNAIQFVDFEGTTNIVYPRVVEVVINFNDNLQSDADAVFYLYYKTLTGVNNDFGEINAEQVLKSNLTDVVGSEVNNKVSGATDNTFQYAYDEDNAGGAKTAGVDFDVVAVAIGLSSGVYVSSEATITTAGATISLVAPLERNYINP